MPDLVQPAARRADLARGFDDRAKLHGGAWPDAASRASRRPAPLPERAKGCYATQMTLAGLNLRDFEYIVAVAEERHFGRAAARCHVSQSALSVQVRKVEDLLGIQIFERTNRRVVVTALGERVVERARALLQVGHELIDLRGLGQQPFGGGLTLGAIPTVGPT